jgi:hypothetical protein
LNKQASQKGQRGGARGLTVPPYIKERNTPAKTNQSQEIQKKRFLETATYEQKQAMENKMQGKQGYQGKPKTPFTKPGAYGPSGNPIVDLQVYETQKQRDKVPKVDPSVYLDVVAPSYHMLDAMHYPYRKYYGAPIRPLINNYSINMSGPTDRHSHLSMVFEDMLPGKDFNATMNTLGERRVVHDYIRSMFVTQGDGDNVTFSSKDNNSLVNYIKFLEINPYHYSYTSNNPYKQLPKGMLLYRSCYPIRYDYSSSSVSCAKNSIGMNVRIYKLSMGEYNVNKQDNLDYSSYDVWREVAFYEFIREKIIKPKVCPNFVNMYAYFVWEDCTIDFNKLETIRGQTPDNQPRYKPTKEKTSVTYINKEPYLKLSAENVKKLTDSQKKSTLQINGETYQKISEDLVKKIYSKEYTYMNGIPIPNKKGSLDEANRMANEQYARYIQENKHKTYNFSVPPFNFNLPSLSSDVVIPPLRGGSKNKNKKKQKGGGAQLSVHGQTLAPSQGQWVGSNRGRSSMMYQTMNANKSCPYKGDYTSDYEINENAYSGKALVILTEAPTHNMRGWASRTYEVAGRISRMTNTGYYDEKVWYSILFQLMVALYTLQIHNISINGFSIENNVYIKDLGTGGRVTNYWKYIVDGLEYYVPNYGYLVLIDSNYKEPPKSEARLLKPSDRCCGDKEAHRIHSSIFIQKGGKKHDDTKIRKEVCDSFKTIFSKNEWTKKFTNNGGVEPPEAILNMLEKIYSDTGCTDQYVDYYIHKHMRRFLHNRVGTYLKEIEVQDFRRNMGGDFKRGELVVYEANNDTFEWVIFDGLAKEKTKEEETKEADKAKYKTGVARILTRHKANSDVIEDREVPIGNLHRFTKHIRIEQNFKPAESNLNEDELLETYKIFRDEPGKYYDS